MDKQTVKIITYRGKDAPDIGPRLAALEASLRAFVGDSTDSLSKQVAEALATLESWRSSQELANGVMDSSISEIETKVSEILSALQGKTDSSELASLRGDLLAIVTNLSRELAKKANVSDLPKPIVVVADSDNVTITKKDENTYGISVDVQEKVVETIIKEVGKNGGGLSKAAVQKLIDAAIAGIEISGGGTYIPLEITSFTGGSQAEIGDTVASVTLNWTYNKAVTSQNLDEGIGSLPIGDRTYTYNTPIVTNTTFTLTGSDGITTDTANTSVTFVSRRFWGVTSSGSQLLEANIEAGSNELSSSRAKSITFDCTGGRRIFYAYPKSLGLATVKDGNGNKFTDWLLSTGPYEVTIINTFGYSQVYYVYHSKNVYNSATVEFSWS